MASDCKKLSQRNVSSKLSYVTLRFFFSKQNQDRSVMLFQNCQSKLPIQSYLVLVECFQTDKSGTVDLHRVCQREASEGEACPSTTAKANKRYAKFILEQKEEIGKRAAEHLRLTTDTC